MPSLTVPCLDADTRALVSDSTEAAGIEVITVDIVDVDGVCYVWNGLGDG